MGGRHPRRRVQGLIIPIRRLRSILVVRGGRRPLVRAPVIADGDAGDDILARLVVTCIRIARLLRLDRHILIPRRDWLRLRVE